MPEAVLHFESVSKKFKRGESFDSLRDLIPAAVRSLLNRQPSDELQDREFWAVRDVSFDVHRGESVGIVGRNGSGKSTTLKLLTGILKPTRGNICVKGRMSALIEVGAGFHPDLTGRENIHLNGAILGMSRKQIERRFDQIVEFSELADFIDTPVKRYSSGMYARLGFSVAAHLESEILLVDEVLSVGDVGFQAKCMDRMRELQRAGTTIVFVSHNMNAVLSICDKAVHLDCGMLIATGPSHEVVREYRTRLNTGRVRHHDPDSRVIIRRVTFYDVQGQPRGAFDGGETATLRISLQAKDPIIDPVLGIQIFHENGACVFGHNTKGDRWPITEIHGDVDFELTYDSLRLQPGQYFVTVTLCDSLALHPYCKEDKAFEFTVAGISLPDLGVTYFPHSYKVRFLEPTQDSTFVK